MTRAAIQVSVEPVAEADLPVIRSLAERIWRASYPGMISMGQIEYMLDWMYAIDRLREDLRSGVVFEWARFEGSPVGYLATQVESASEVLHLHKLYVLPEFHGRGIGSHLIDRALRIAESAGCRTVRLNVNKANARAIACYQRHGFTREASVVNDIGGGYVMDDHVMVRPIQPPSGART